MKSLLHVIVAATLLGAGSSGCSLVATYERCGSGCPGDAEITAAIEQAIAQRGDIWSTDVSVQTLDHVVYLRGLVDTGVQREELVAAAQRVAGVKRVVESLAIRNDSGF